MADRSDGKNRYKVRYYAPMRPSRKRSNVITVWAHTPDEVVDLAAAKIKKMPQYKEGEFFLISNIREDSGKYFPYFKWLYSPYM